MSGFFLPLLIPAWLSLSVQTGPPAEPGFHKSTLKNGLTLISEKNEASAATVLQILIRGGKRAEPAGKGGLAFLTTRLAVEIPDEDKAQELIGMASRFSVTVKGDYSIIQVECLSSQFEPTIKILSRIVLDPLFSGLRIDAVKKHAEHQGRIEEDDSSVLGHIAGVEAFFGSPGYGGSIYGNKATLEAVKGRDISDFYKRFFVAPNMIIVLSSDREDAPSLVEKYFAGLPASPPAPLEAVIVRAPEQRKVSLQREMKQTYVSLVFALPPLSQRRFALGLILETLLGKGPGSRLWPLRTEKKLAYTVNCRATQMVDGGTIEAYLETDQSKTGEALTALHDVITGLWRSGVNAEELQAGRTLAWGDFLRGNEARTARTATLAAFGALGLGLEGFSGLDAEFEAITPAEINAFIQNVLTPEKAVEVTIGRN